MAATYAITIGAPGSGVRNSERGWYLHDRPRESAGRPDYTWQTWGEAGVTTDPFRENLPSTMLLREIDALVCRPWPRTSDQIPLTEWTAFGAGATTWEERDGIGNLGCLFYQQLDCSLTTEHGLCMAYSAPPNPGFGIGLRRYALDPEWSFATLGDGYTKIVWGGGEFCLLIPYNGPAALYDAARDYCCEVPLRGGHAGGADMEELSIWIWHVGGKLLISNDSHSWFVYSRGNDADNAINTAEGPIQVSHVGSGWMFALWPMDFPTTGTYQSKTYDKGYTPTTTLEGGGPSGSWCDWQANLWQGSVEPSIDITELSADARYSQYQADLNPVSYVVGSTYFGHTPELYAVRLQNKPKTTTVASVSAPTIDTGHLMSIEVEDAVDLESNSASLLLNNRGGEYEDFPSYAPVAIALAGRDGVLVSMFDGYTYNPQAKEARNQATTKTLRLLSGTLPFQEVGCVEGEPVFAGKTVAEAIIWTCLRCGVSYDSTNIASEGTTIIPSGCPGERGYQPAAGRSWWEFLKEIAALDQGWFRFVGGKLYYYKARTGTPVATWFFADRQNYPGAPAGTIPILESIEVDTDLSNHRNEVVCIGQDVDGRVIVAKQIDASNKAVVGWEKTMVASDPAWNTPQQLNLVCRTISNRVMPYPPRDYSFRIEGHPAVFPRAFAGFYGGVSDYHGTIAEIRRVVSRWNKATGPHGWRQDIQVRWLSG